MLAAPLMGSLALLWIAIEVTTVISALLVAIEDTDRAAEAAWKYVLIASAGLSLALLATIFAYYAGAQVLGEHYNLAVQPLIDAAAKLPNTRVRLAFLLAVVGSEQRSAFSRCTPGCRTRTPRRRRRYRRCCPARCSRRFYAILRFLQVAVATGQRLPRTR